MVLKIRIIPVILHRGKQAVKGRQFDSWRIIGSAVAQAEIYDARGVDELIFLEIDSPVGRGPDFSLIGELTGKCFVPVAVGGGFIAPADFQLGLLHGADKLCCCHGAFWRPGLLAEVAKKHGSQAVVGCLEIFEQRHVVRVGSEWHYSAFGLEDAARYLVDNGAGEILLSAVDRDGMMGGYDLAAIEAVSAAVSVPVIALGGAGEPLHFKQALNAGAHAVAASAIFAFTDWTPADIAAYLASEGFPVRRD